MTHPCDGHLASCDHCYLCDVVGICCASVSSGLRAQIEASRACSYTELTAAITQDAGLVPGLRDLVRLEAEHQHKPGLRPIPRLLTPPKVSSGQFFDEPRKEASRVVSPRTTQ